MKWFICIFYFYIFSWKIQLQHLPGFQFLIRNICVGIIRIIVFEIMREFKVHKIFAFFFLSTWAARIRTALVESAYSYQLPSYFIFIYIHSFFNSFNLVVAIIPKNVMWILTIQGERDNHVSSNCNPISNAKKKKCMQLEHNGKQTRKKNCTVEFIRIGLQTVFAFEFRIEIFVLLTFTTFFLISFTTVLVFGIRLRYIKLVRWTKLFLNCTEFTLHDKSQEQKNLKIKLLQSSSFSLYSLSCNLIRYDLVFNCLICSVDQGYNWSHRVPLNCVII